MRPSTAPLASFMTFVLFALLVVGITHAYIIPMVPYIQVMFFVMGMMILLVEALIAAPLWAFFHIRMDGQEFVDQVQKPGYMIAFNLLLRPALMILGLMMSYFVFGAAAWFISVTFIPAVAAAGSGQSVGLIGAIVMICIVTYLNFQVALRSFSMINQVLDRVTRWFGYGGEHLGEESDSRQSSMAVVSNVGNKVEHISRLGGVSAVLGGGGGGGKTAPTPSNTANPGNEKPTKP